jgi:hypothetical protein
MNTKELSIPGTRTAQSAMKVAIETMAVRIPAEADQHSWMKPITIPV